MQIGENTQQFGTTPDLIQTKIIELMAELIKMNI